jgi:hypothetical protein
MPMIHTKFFFKQVLTREGKVVGMAYRHAPGINTGSKDLTSLVWAEVIQAYNGVFTPDVNSLLNENLGGILCGMHPMSNGW